MASYRKLASGRVQVQVRRKGFPPAADTFDNLSQARAWARQIEAKLDDGINATIARTRTVADAIHEFKANGNTITSQRDRDRYLAWWEKHYGAMKLIQFKPHVIDEAQKKLAAEPNGSRGRNTSPRTPQTVRHYSMAMSKVMTYTRDTLQWITHNPVAGAHVPPVSLPVIQYATDEQRARLLKACAQSGNPDLETVAEIIFSSGARIGEVVSLRWSWINFKDEVAYLPRSKNNDAKALPLIGRALRLLKVRHKRRDRDNDLVFPSPSKPNQPRNFQNAWNVARQRSGVNGKGTGFHLARHTVATNMIRNDVPPELVMRVLGQRSTAMARRYQHLLPRIVVRAAKKGLRP